MNKTELIILTVITVGLIILLKFFIPQNDITLINFISIISAFVTVIGFYITLKQLKSVKEIANQIDVTVNKKLSDFNKILLLSDVSGKIALIHEIKAHLRKDEFEICVIRMEDLKKVIATIVPNAILLSLAIDEDVLNTIIKNFNINMNTIEKKLLNDSYNIKTDKIILNMDELSTFLLKLEVKLKQY